MPLGATTFDPAIVRGFCYLLYNRYLHNNHGIYPKKLKTRRRHDLHIAQNPVIFPLGFFFRKTAKAS